MKRKELYLIRIVREPIDWTAIEPMPIDCYCWGGDYRPEAFAKIVFLKGRGFAIRTACREDNPRAVYTVPNSPVCRDSCLEFFAAFDASRPDCYINFECNAAGCLLSEYGTNQNRTFIDRLGCEMPVPQVYRENGFWGWELFVPLSLLEKLFGPISFQSGTVIRANAYKCGDDTEVPHYGSWQPIDYPHPSFHRPECFGDMIIHI